MTRGEAGRSSLASVLKDEAGSAGEEGSSVEGSDCCDNAMAASGGVEGACASWAMPFGCCVPAAMAMGADLGAWGTIRTGDH